MPVQAGGMIADSYWLVLLLELVPHLSRLGHLPQLVPPLQLDSLILDSVSSALAKFGRLAMATKFLSFPACSFRTLCLLGGVYANARARAIDGSLFIAC